MKRVMLWMAVFAALPVQALLAQDLTGTWQGTLTAPNGNQLRLVFQISRAEDESLRGVAISIDQGGARIPVNPVTLQGSAVKMSVPAIGGTYEGALSDDGNSIDGTWSQGPGSTDLDLARATPETAFAIPEPPAPPKPMVDDDPEFEVATIKPSDPNRPGKAFTMRARQFLTINTTLNDMITFAYGIHATQISDGPGWMATDKYDITAQPESEGQPNQTQIRTMMEKLLAERFNLKFHRENRELSVYAITRGDGEPNLTPSEAAGSLPSLFFRGLGNLPVRNATIADLAGVLQGAVLDRPVVDQTGIEGRYDFTLTWTPDEFQFANLGGPPPPGAAPANGADAPPDLFTAMREQLGLKLEATKAPAEVLVIDSVDMPSEN